MRTSSGISFVTGVILLSTGPASAQTLTAVSGKPVRMLFFTDTINPDCTANGTTTIRVSQAPQNGAVRITKTRDFARFAASNLRSICNTRRVAGSAAFYTSRRGYLGPDSVGLEIISAHGAFLTRNYTINVR